jgi:hypothetical protein
MPTCPSTSDVKSASDWRRRSWCRRAQRARPCWRRRRARTGCRHQSAANASRPCGHGTDQRAAGRAASAPGSPSAQLLRRTSMCGSRSGQLALSQQSLDLGAQLRRQRSGRLVQDSGDALHHQSTGEFLAQRCQLGMIRRKLPGQDAKTRTGAREPGGRHKDPHGRPRQLAVSA